MTRIWLVNWHFQSRITLWCRHKSINVSMGLCWQMPMFIVWRLWSIYFDHHLPLKPFIGKRRKQSCTPNIIKQCSQEFAHFGPIPARDFITIWDLAAGVHIRFDSCFCEIGLLRKLPLKKTYNSTSRVLWKTIVEMYVIIIM